VVYLEAILERDRPPESRLVRGGANEFPSVGRMRRRTIAMELSLVTEEIGA